MGKGASHIHLWKDFEGAVGRDIERDFLFRYRGLWRGEDGWIWGLDGSVTHIDIGRGLNFGGGEGSWGRLQEN